MHDFRFWGIDDHQARMILSSWSKVGLWHGMCVFCHNRVTHLGVVSFYVVFVFKVGVDARNGAVLYIDKCRYFLFACVFFFGQNYISLGSIREIWWSFSGQWWHLVWKIGLDTFAAIWFVRFSTPTSAVCSFMIYPKDRLLGDLQEVFLDRLFRQQDWSLWCLGRPACLRILHKDASDIEIRWLPEMWYSMSVAITQ